MTNKAPDQTAQSKPVTNVSRAEMREKIFSSKNRKRKTVEVFGQTLEMLQPTLGEVFEAREEKDAKKMVAKMIINYCYVPGTNEKVFEPADMDQILNMPFGDEFMAMQNAINELTGIDVGEQEKNLSGPLDD